MSTYLNQQHNPLINAFLHNAKDRLKLMLSLNCKQGRENLRAVNFPFCLFRLANHPKQPLSSLPGSLNCCYLEGQDCAPHICQHIPHDF